MDSRHRNWNDMFGAGIGGQPVSFGVSTTPAVTCPLSKPSASSPADLSMAKLEELWAQSLALREHALQIRAVSMEVRAMARDLRLRNQAA
jgi:hypothetical protein